MTQECPCVQIPHNYAKKEICHWQRSMREFLESRKEKCKREDPVGATHTVMDFMTGSSYEGGYEDMNMRGDGEYTFPNGVLYRGEFENGMCHGDGELVYNHGPKEFTIIRGLWEKGILKDGKIYFNGILEYNEEDWKYCKIPDRRYEKEFNKELKPAGKSNITAEQPPREIPPGFIDNGYGFYNPKTKTLYKHHNVSEVAKAPSDREQKWIEDNCRMEPAPKVGPRPDLYETWLGPDLDPPPLPSPLVGFTSINRAPSMIGPDVNEDEEAAKPVFYDTRKSYSQRPPRKFQPSQNKNK